jgi:ribosomal protein L12E/L44/L45/RPP1/RPP2
VGVEADAANVSKLLGELDGKDISELIAAGALARRTAAFAATWVICGRDACGGCCCANPVFMIQVYGRTAGGFICLWLAHPPGREKLQSVPSGGAVAAAAAPAAGGAAPAAKAEAKKEEPSEEDEVNIREILMTVRRRMAVEGARPPRSSCTNARVPPPPPTAPSPPPPRACPG